MQRFGVLMVRPQDWGINLVDTDVRFTLVVDGSSLQDLKKQLKKH